MHNTLISLGTCNLKGPNLHKKTGNEMFYSAADFYCCKTDI